MKHSSFNATISALYVKTSVFGAATSAIAPRSFDATISVLNAETSALDAETSAIALSYQRYRHGVSGDICNCGVGITPQMSNRVTNHGDMSTFFKPVSQPATSSADLSAMIVNWHNTYYIITLNYTMVKVFFTRRITKSAMGFS